MPTSARLPDWKTVSKAALVDVIRNTPSVPISANLTRQDKCDLTNAVQSAWRSWDEAMRADFLDKLAAEVDYQRQKRQRA